MKLLLQISDDTHTCEEVWWSKTALRQEISYQLFTGNNSLASTGRGEQSSLLLSSAGGEQQKWCFLKWVLRGSSDGGALSVWLEAKDAGNSFAQVQRSGLGAQDSTDVDRVEPAKVISRCLIPTAEGRQSACEQYICQTHGCGMWLGVRELASLPVWHLIFWEHLNPWVVLGRFSRRFWLCNKSHPILFLHCC